MKLTIKFSAVRYYAVSKEEENIGLDYVAKIRNEIDDSSLSLDKIPGKIHAISQNPEIEISEKLAIASGKFKKTSCIKVIVDDHGFNKYVFPDFEIEKNLKTGDIKIIAQHVINWDQALKDWEKAGYPLTWHM